MSTLVNSSPAMAPVLAENEMQQIKLLTATDDEYGGVIVELSESMDSQFFASILRASITQWRKQVLLQLTLGYIMIACFMLYLCISVVIDSEFGVSESFPFFGLLKIA